MTTQVLDYGNNAQIFARDLRINSNGKIYAPSGVDLKFQTSGGGAIDFSSVALKNFSTASQGQFIKLDGSSNVVGLSQIQTAHIEDDSISFAKMKSNSVSTAQIVDGSITQAKLDGGISFTPVDGSITTDKLADSAVTTVKINDSAVSSAKLASNSVVTAKVNDLAITNAKINDVDYGKITGLTSNGSLLYNNSNLVAESDITLSSNVLSLGSSNKLRLPEMQFLSAGDYIKYLNINTNGAVSVNLFVLNCTENTNYLLIFDLLVSNKTDNNANWISLIYNVSMGSAGSTPGYDVPKNESYKYANSTGFTITQSGSANTFTVIGNSVAGKNFFCKGFLKFLSS